MSYVDGYVFPIAKAKLAAYESMAEKGGEIWMKHGALAYYECVGDDLAPDMGAAPDEDCPPMTPFPRMAGAGPDETVIFSFIVYRDRAHRDAVNKAVMEDPGMRDPGFGPDDMPFDMARMAYGGFRPIVSHGIGNADLFEEQ